MHVLAIVQSLVESFGRHHVEVLGLLRELCDIVVRAGTHTAAQHFARKERNVAFEAQVLDNVVVDLLDIGGPLAVTGIRFALVEDDSLDDTVFLGLLGHFNQATIRVAAIGVDSLGHPALLALGVASVLVLVEQLDAASCNSDHNDAHLDLGVRLFDHRAAEIVRGAEFCTLTVRKRRHGSRPFALGLPGARAIVGRPENLETFVNCLVLLPDIALTFHVRLPEGEVDMEIRVRGCVYLRKSHCEGCS